MKAMEDQVVQEEPGYQDDEVYLWLIEKYVQQVLFDSVTKSMERQEVPKDHQGVQCI